MGMSVTREFFLEYVGSYKETVLNLSGSPASHTHRLPACG